MTGSCVGGGTLSSSIFFYFLYWKARMSVCQPCEYTHSKEGRKEGRVVEEGRKDTGRNEGGKCSGRKEGRREG